MGTGSVPAPVTELLCGQLEHAFAAARWQVDGLTDDEYLWEPQPGCWSVRRRRDAVSRQPAGVGPWVLDGEWPVTEAPPPTTIGWRLVHLTGWTNVYLDWTFGEARFGYMDITVPATAAEAVAGLARSQRGLLSEIASLSDEDLPARRPVHDGSELSIATLLWQIAVEHLHHSAEIGTLRDLHRGQVRTDPWPEPRLGTDR